MNNNMNNMEQPVMQQPVNNGAGIDVNKIINDIKKDPKNFLAIAGAILTIIACFVNIITVKMTILRTQSQSWNLMNIASGNKAYYEGSDYAGIILIILAVATIVLVVLKKHVYTVISAGLSFLTLIIEFFKIKNYFNDKVGKGYEDYIKLKWNAGLFIAILGIAAMGASLYFLWKENPNCFKELIAKAKSLIGGNKANATVQPVQAQTPVQPTYQAPVQPVQPAYEAPQATVAPVETETVETTVAPVENEVADVNVPTENINNDINNNIM